MHVKILHDGVVSDGARGYLAAGTVIDVPHSVAEALVRNGHADGDIPEAFEAMAADDEDLVAIEGADVREEVREADEDLDPPPARRRRAAAKGAP